MVAPHRQGPLPVSGRIFLGILLFQLIAFILPISHLPKKTAPGKNEPFAEPASVYPPPREPMPMSRMSFTEDMTFNGECRSSKLWNKTWGRTVAPWVDKIDSKQLVENMGTSVKTVPTIAVYDINNITNFTVTTMYQLPNSVIKPAYYTGHAARILDNEYFCFKCAQKKHLRLDGYRSNLHHAHKEALKKMRYTLEKVPLESLVAREPQYKYLPRRIIIEEYLPMETMSEYTGGPSMGSPFLSAYAVIREARDLGRTFRLRFKSLSWVEWTSAQRCLSQRPGTGCFRSSR
jgi:hypothetical protein